MLSTEELLAPVSADQPCGEDLAFSSELDAIARAREADDPSLDQGEWQSELKEADWKFVASGCAKLIAGRSKDLRLAVWLAEARAKTAGLRGLGDALLLVAGLCERYWDGLLPLPDEGSCEQRSGNLCWIEARIPQLAREVKLTEGAGTNMSLIDMARARARGAGGATEVDAARLATSRKFAQALLADSLHCVAAVAELRRVTDLRLGADGPGFTAAQAALQDVIHFLTPAAREPGASSQPDQQANQQANPQAGLRPAPPQAPEQGAAAGGPLQSRAQALAQLRAVAEFFRRTEPHSPVAYLAERAAAWGEQSLHVWLRGVVKDPAVCAQLEEMLGVQTPE
ncbi:MAG: type VI secretion system protein TssA [Pseudomonadota bacterium]|nr:type VI secretion system protein TssA [Pseudomonadota bacterium]